LFPLCSHRKQSGEYQPKKEHPKLAASTVPTPKEKELVISTPAPAPSLKRELESEEDQEAKRRRRLQALAMISGKEVDYSAVPPPENVPTSAPNTEPQDRDDNLANIAAAISNRAIGGKLVLKSNAKPAKKAGLPPSRNVGV
jgi:hypothetical protein